MLIKAKRSFYGFDLNAIEGRIYYVNDESAKGIIRAGFGVTYRPSMTTVRAASSFDHPMTGEVDFDQIIDIPDDLARELISRGLVIACCGHIYKEAPAPQSTKRRGRKKK